MSRVLVIARPDARRARLCAGLADAGYQAVAVDDAAAFRASRDWSLYDVLVVAPHPSDPAADETLRTYVSRFRPRIVMLDARWDPEATRLAVAHRQRTRGGERGTRRMPADYYGTPAEIVAVEHALLAAAVRAVPRAALMAATQAAGFAHWSGRMVKYVVRRLEEKGELRADDVSGLYAATDAGRDRVARARTVARSA